MLHEDLVGRELLEGDVVAYPTSGYSSSTHMCVARIVKIEDFERTISTYNRETRERGSKNVTQWKVRLQPLVYTGYRTDKRYYRDGEGEFRSEPTTPKAVTVTKVENLVKVDSGDSWE